MIHARLFPPGIQIKRCWIGSDLLGNIIEHRFGQYLIGHERAARITHQAELHREAKPIMLPSADLDFKPVGR